MRRAFGYAGAWLMATSGAAAVAWLGCALVLNQAVPPAPHVPSSVQPRTVVDAAGAPAPAPPRTSTPRVSRGERPAPPVGLDVPTDVQHSVPPARTQPSPPAPTRAAAPGTTASTITVRGGHVSVLFSPRRVQVLAAVPATGYQYTIDQTQPTEVWVIFARQGQESHLFVSWDGRPTANVTEYWW
jgi:hypothetical protein